ncbi:enoyl-CoA hydratase/isomerase domain-containing protein [Hirsutella rhossiliensis]|uniref:Enoyl-CoA hydratase/isomerase domain-containing protein n=1 Tax=Hirsutella rhossiliensis TaxID=111463 RepID=A0A9P8MVY3_9HYPO|nr:enoyl-CoA hydratase/isomerase domain-containing protein [Hirsutella rhossiliensis]KAH0962387.1 enoyl-CoA hydratase/isomerase domain-containing protein [Hirsutella rhossiliensis]
MSPSTLPDSYTTLSLPALRFAHHPPSSASVTPVIVVSLHRPAARNAFTDTMANSLVAAFNMLSDDPRVRAVVLASSDPASKTFCVGMDFNDAGDAPLVEKAELHRDQGGRVALAMYSCAKPVVAAVNGSAVGVGITMTLPANVRIASRGAKVGFVFGRRGFCMEACSSFFLPRLVGASKALHLVSTAAVYPAEHKLFSDLFSDVVAPDQVLPTALAIADDMAANVSPVASRLMKDMIYRAPATPEDAHLLESRLFHALILGDDAQEGRASFLQKRRPDFKATMDDAPAWYPWWSPVDVRVKPKI